MLSHHLSLFLPLSDKLAFPVILALGIVGCTVRKTTLCSDDRTRTVSLCLIVRVSGGGCFLFYCIVCSSLNCSCTNAAVFKTRVGECILPGLPPLSQYSLVHATHWTHSQCFHYTQTQRKVMNLSKLLCHCIGPSLHLTSVMSATTKWRKAVNKRCDCRCLKKQNKKKTVIKYSLKLKLVNCEVFALFITFCDDVSLQP